MTRELVYGRRPVYEALRGRRAVLELHASERAQRSETWLRDDGAPRVQVAAERELTELAAAGRARSIGRARARRWLSPPLAGFTTILLLPAALPLQ